MIYYDTREEFREEYRAYVYEQHSHVKKITKQSYFNESFSAENSEESIDFWEAICDVDLAEIVKNETKDSWIGWTVFYSEDPATINHNNYLKGIDRIVEFVNKRDYWKERIKSESHEVNQILSTIIIENQNLSDNAIIEMLQEKIGNYNKEFLERISNFRYLKGEDYVMKRLRADTLELFLDSFHGADLDNALSQVKDYFIMHHVKFNSQNNYLIKKMGEYSRKRNANIEFPLDFLSNYEMKPTYDLEKAAWIIFGDYATRDSNRWELNDYKKSIRINAIPIGARIILAEQISINDEMSKFFDKGIRILSEGVVEQNLKDGNTLIINWDKDDINKIWYYDTFSGDLSYIEAKNVSKRNFMDFLNGKSDQDIDRYIRKFGKKQSKADQATASDDDGDGSKLLENPYVKKDFLEEVFLGSIEYDKLENLLSVKQNIILQGAPGVGKTYMAKRLAYSLIGSVNNEYVLQLQFHQSYSYEDLIMGYRPTETHFELVEGPFYEFCRKAIDDSENDYYVIIDEINRGNVSKIFGELLMLIESDKRGEEHAIKLMYSNEDFFIPSNLYIIGMMNTADRSLAIIDYALRRRFAFYSMKPAFDNQRFIQTLKDSDNQKLEKLVEGIKVINKEIREDDSLGVGFEIGHSYFTKNFVVKDAHVNNILDYEIEPLLREYWYDNEEKVNSLLRMLKGKINE